MINNTRKILKLLDFQSDDDFYHLQVLKRKKENPELGRNSYLLKSFCVTSNEYLESKMDEIINLCEFHKGRAYINLNKRSFEKIALEVNHKISKQLKQKDYYSVRKSYDSVLGDSEGMNQKRRRWVVDIDTHDHGIINEITEFIQTIEPLPKHGGDRILELLKTPNGVHLITHGFNTQVFKERYPDVDIQKNNPTILYTSI